MNQGLLWSLLMGCATNSVKNWKMMGALPFGYIFMAYLDIGGEHRYHLPFDLRVWTPLSKKIL